MPTGCGNQQENRRRTGSDGASLTVKPSFAGTLPTTQFYPLPPGHSTSAVVCLCRVRPVRFVIRWYYDESQEHQHSRELMSQSLDAAQTSLSGLVLAIPFSLYLWPMSLFLNESQISRQAAALADRKRLWLASRTIRRHERQTRLRCGLGTTPA